MHLNIKPTLEIKRIDKSLPLPQYETAGSVAVDLYSRKDLEIKPKEIGLIPSNLIIDVPAEYMLTVVPRSSTPKKLGLAIPHGIGIIDQDYFGPDDEIKIQVRNFTNNTIKIKKGQKIAQAVFVKISKVSWEETNEVNNKSRGGFGSTD